MQLKPGTRLTSSACETEVIVVKAPDQDLELTCCGVPMTLPGEGGAVGSSGSGGGAGDGDGTQLGKRYVNEDESLEILCTKAGTGSVSIGETPLAVKESKPLPASD